MPPYVPENVAPGGQIDPEKINQNFSNIARAYNTHENSDFPADCVPVTAVVADQAQAPLSFGFHGQLAGAQVIGTQQKDIVIPFDCTLVAGWVICSAASDAISEVNIYHETDAAYLWAANTVMVAAETPYNAGAPAKSDFSSGDVLTLRMIVAAGQTIDDVIWTLLLKAQHQS